MFSLYKWDFWREQPFDFGGGGREDWNTEHLSLLKKLNKQKHLRVFLVPERLSCPQGELSRVSLIARVAVAWVAGQSQCLRGAAPVLLNHVGGRRGARCGIRGPSCPASALTGASWSSVTSAARDSPVAAPPGARGGLGTSSPAGECPLWGDADRPFTLETCPQGMELSTRSVGMSRNCQSGQGCEWVQLARLVCGFWSHFYVFFFGKAFFFHPARISRNICFCPCVEVRNEPKPPPTHPTSPHWQDSPSGISFPFVTALSCGCRKCLLFISPQKYVISRASPH